MRTWVCLPVAVCLGFVGAVPASAADRLHLSDEGLPLQEIRPLDRHVYILTLEGTWSGKPAFGAAHYVNVQFPNGAVYTHRVLDEGLFEKGEVRVLLPEYRLLRNGVARGGDLIIYVTARRDPYATPEVISDRLVIHWPMERPVVRPPVATRYSAPPPIDRFPGPGEMPAPRPPQVVPPPREAPPAKPAPPKKS